MEPNTLLMSGRSEDTYLLSRVSMGDRLAFRDIYLHYIPDLYRFANSICNNEALSEDIVQSVFIHLWEARESMGKIKELRIYLFHSVKNRILNELRKEKQIKAYTEYQSVQIPSYETPEDILIHKERLKLAEEALSKLSPQRKRIVELRTKQELTLDEIASQLSISKNVVKKQLYKGLAFMRSYLREHGELTLSLLLLNLLIHFIK
ncbi:RNA polymerase sigma-70 factor, ECF subfamily [bacterium A37T11]|nr:RNA polymerase sigma-70 factor, ECF subfamily [bacterium A37T11]